MASAPLPQLGDDELGEILGKFVDVLLPHSACAFAATCNAVWLKWKPQAAEREALYKAVRVMLKQLNKLPDRIDWSPDDLSEAVCLGSRHFCLLPAEGEGVTPWTLANVTTLAEVLRTNGLKGLKVLDLGAEDLGDERTIALVLGSLQVRAADVGGPEPIRQRHRRGRRLGARRRPQPWCAAAA